MIAIILFIIGFVLLVKGADLLVDGSYFIARHLKVSELAIGLTVVAFGTSLPELVVNLSASFRGAADLAIGNVFGSNIANVFLILGVSAIICPLPLQKKTIVSEIPFTLIAALLVGFLANAALFMDEKAMILSRWDGLILIFFFGLYLVYIMKTSKENQEIIYKKEVGSLSVKKSIIYIIVGIIGLFLGGKWIVDGAIYMAQMFKLSEGFIGLTVVAIGTSLPELVTSVTAAKKGNIDIAVGNVIGSNIFNLLWVLAISSIIKPLPFSGINNIDIIIMVFSCTLIIFAMATGVRNAIDRKNGIFFLFVYAIYLVYIFYRG
ncbi:MAG: calcium/sodium antiporter [Candidatus Cloacimonetes bacterium]|nr:calcium/sodium antiporter [Candidatus Cloacimonadota bacterium]